MIIGKSFHSRLAMLPLVLLAGAAEAAPPPPAPVPAVVVADKRGPDGPGIWDYAAVDSRAGRVLVARMTEVETAGLEGNQPGDLLAVGQHVHAVLPLSDHRVLFTNGDANTVTIVDSLDGVVLVTLKTGAKPDGAVFDPASNQVLVMNGNDGTVTRIDVRPRIATIVGTIAVGGVLEAPALDGQGRLFVNIEDRNEIAVVSLPSGTVTAHYPLAGCEGPTGLSFDPAHRLLVSACANGIAKVLRDSGTEVASLSIGPHPDAVIADPAHDRVFIPSGGDGTLSDITLDGMPHVTRVMTTRPGARTGAYDPRTQRLYLPYGQIIRTKGQPPVLVPGSYGILVVDAR